MAGMLAAPLASAQNAGLLRRSLTGSDILLACRMLASHRKLDGQADFRASFDRRLALLHQGLRAPDGAAAHPPARLR